MDPIEAAIEAIESREPGEHFTYTEVANRYNVSRHTLARRHKRVQAPRAAHHVQQQQLDPAEELQLIEHIKQLTRDGLAPTRAMIQNFASSIAGNAVSESWVTRFLHRHPNELASHWTTGLDRTRHKADSIPKYESYFNLLSTKMHEYHVQPKDIYNMDEKGFMLGVTGRSKRVFSKQMYDHGGYKKVIQDGNREWITVLAAVCADGSALPPSVIYQSASNAIYDRWVQDIQAEEDSVFVTSTSSGWTNNEVGLAWLIQVFDRCTKAKSLNRPRMLLLDGHGSHVTLDFIEYCTQNRIHLLVLPPHSTHTLQPLDVVMFKPLASAYSKELQEHLQRTRGLTPMKKGDFWPIFRRAWASSFIEKHIFKSFKATGVVPLDPEEVLKKFRTSTPTPPRGPLSVLRDVNRRTISHLVDTAVDPRLPEANIIKNTLLDLHTSNEILQYENKGLQVALRQKKKPRKPNQPLSLQQPAEGYHGGAVWWSPRKLKEARLRQAAKEKEEEEEQLRKVRTKELKDQVRLMRLKEAEEKKVERERTKRDKEKAEAVKAAAREAQKTTNNAQNPIPQPQSGKRKASQSRPRQPQRKKTRVSGARRAVAKEAPAPPPPPSTTRRGRTINTPGRYR